MATETGVHFEDAVAPEGVRLYAVGDIHGCHELMSKMHQRIMAEIMTDQPPDWRVIYLGDYIDRGPASRQVLDFLASATQSDSRIVALAGNHDIGFLDFLAEPSPDSLFANNGGDATAFSYGVDLHVRSPEAFAQTSESLRKAVPEEHLTFMRGLRLSVTFGDFFFCHAGIRPGIPLADQSSEDLVWIRERFRRHTGLHPKVVVHGHTPVTGVEIMPNRVNLDTGACFTGRLSAMVFEGSRKRLLEVVA